MSLPSGTRLGPYEIVAPLGAGGMGEVYRATDTRLSRTVAIKILPAQLCEKPNARQRFEREARAISSLQHPHICTLHDVGHQEGVDFLVMEYLEGETLSHRLANGPLPPEQVLKLGIEMCEGLGQAHRNGIAHRDLKPGNIMLTKTGAKLLDFGLAKPLEVVPATSLTSLPTTSKPLSTHARDPLTEEGKIVGTFQYMSPEQLEGKEADARSDIFALGAVLHEMATGKRAFEGKSQASVVAAVLEREPPAISSLQPISPPALDHVVKVCLAKNPEERWQAAHDVRMQLQWIAASGSQAGVPAPVVARRKRRELILAAVAAVAIAAAIFFGALYSERAPAQPHAIRSYIKPAANSDFSVFNGGPVGFALSPDGLRLAYVASALNGKSVLWIRSLDSLQAEALAGTEGAVYPFWSPDSRFIGFFAGGKLKKIDASGGPPLTLCDASVGRGGTWNQEGIILFTPAFTGPLFRVSAVGGAATAVTTLDLSKNESTHRWPYFLPDGHHFLYLAGNPFTPEENPTNAILLGSLDSKESKLLLHAHSNAIFASGHILFLRQNTLMAQPFDAKRLEITGDAFPVADQVQDVAARVQGIFSASENGVLAYSEAARGGGRQLAWFDRSGKQTGELPGTDAYSDPHISPDGKKLAFTLESPTFDIWVYDVMRGVKTRFTFGSASSAGNLSPVWSPDGRRIAYTSVRSGKFGIYQKAADGSGGEEVLLEPVREQVFPADWSPDGKFMAYWRSQPGGDAEIWILPLEGDHKPYPFLQSPAFQMTAYFSPDGKWVAYCSNESGRFEVYIRPFPGPGGKWQVSTEGGWYPHWRRDGREIFYLSSDSKLMSAEVKANGSSLEVGAVHPLFETRPYYGQLSANLYDVTADGQRFTIAYEAPQSNAAITLVVNWPADLRK